MSTVKGFGFWVIVLLELKRDGEVVKEFSMDKELALKAIDRIQDFDKTMTLIVCASDAAYVHSSISEEMYKVVKSSYERVIKTDSFETIETRFIKITVFDTEGRSTALRAHVERTMMDRFTLLTPRLNGWILRHCTHIKERRLKNCKTCWVSLMRRRCHLVTVRMM